MPSGDDYYLPPLDVPKMRAYMDLLDAGHSSEAAKNILGRIQTCQTCGGQIDAPPGAIVVCICRRPT